MPTTAYKCDVCGSEFQRLSSAEECEVEHAREKTKTAVVDRCGAPVWRCLCEIEKWGLQKNWHMLVADLLTAFRKGEFDQPGAVHDKV